MNTYFPYLCTRYPVSLGSPGIYLTVDHKTAGRFRWNQATLAVRIIAAVSIDMIGFIFISL